ncbi:MAG: acyl-CoA dehydrogenase [Planctomycetota bacterium]
MIALVSVGLFALALTLLYFGRAWLAVVLPAAIGLAYAGYSGDLRDPRFIGAAAALVLFVLLSGVPVVRRALITRALLPRVRKMLPRMSETERVALEAGTVWWDGELFSGRPNWGKLADHRGPGLSIIEQGFLQRELEDACRLCDPDEVDRTGDLSPELWDHLKRAGFFGMIIPKEYGGLGFSPEANSAVVTKASSHNVTLGITIMVPNSLGPAELLLHYGTDAQKAHFLPRLARGEEIPAFALTEPYAGSDAGALESRGVVCHGTWEGAEVLGLRLDWDKRYITMAPKATLLGLAFRALDPDGLLGEEHDLGITCALVPVHLQGVETGRRHDPLGVKFINGPTTGRSVFIPLSHVIGDRDGLGQGWRMLMDCLSAGRSLSLPGLSCGTMATTTRAVSAYAHVREQFGMPIARFEGVEEKLARIYAKTWAMDAARRVTASAVATGEKPSVVSAIMKWVSTEEMRDVVNDAMDVMAGAAICRGPRNVLSRAYQVIPIGITVEGANILTRTLIVFGQGALRCHPFAFAEVRAAQADDLKAFDRAFWGHIGHALSTGTRALVLGLTGGRLARTPFGAATAPHAKRLTRLSAAFALVSEGAMASLGGELKRRERLTGRLADALAWLYLGSCAIKQFEDDGQPSAEEPLMHWAATRATAEIESALVETLNNLPNRALAWLIRWVAFPWGPTQRRPSDALESHIAQSVHGSLDLRSRLTRHIFLPANEAPGLGQLDRAFVQLHRAAGIQKRIKEAVALGHLPKLGQEHLADAALAQGTISAAEREVLQSALALKRDAIQVDAYAPPAYLARCGA